MSSNKEAEKEDDFRNAKKMLTSKIDKKALAFLKNVSKKAKKVNIGKCQKTETEITRTENNTTATTIKKPTLHETLTSVSAVLSPDLMLALPYDKLDKVVENCNVTLERRGEEFVVVGSWDMIQSFKSQLDDLKDKLTDQVENELAVKGILDESVPAIKREPASLKEEFEDNSKLLEVKDLDHLESQLDIEMKDMSSEVEEDELAQTQEMLYIQGDKYDQRNMIAIAPNKGQIHRVLGKTPELATEMCEYCGYRSSKEGVNRHKQRRHSKVVYQCEVCNAAFGVRYDMRRHRLNHFDQEGQLNKKGQRIWDKLHPEMDSELVNYRDFEENFKSLTNTTNVVEGENTVSTESNEAVDKSEQVLKDNEMNDKASDRKVVRYPPKDTSRGDCPICGKNFPLKVMPVHLKIHRQKEIMPCEYCAKVFTERGKLNAHVRTKHEKKYKCDMCGLYLSGSTALKVHIEGKHGLRVECEICQKSFSTAASLLSHQKREHQKEKPFTCETCYKGFFEKRGLENHKITHLDETTKEAHKKFTCAYCPKKFLVKTTLHMHENTHTGNKPFKCTFEGCSKAFPYASMLNKHKKAHSSEKKFQCSFCPKAFKFPYKLRHHTILHTKSRVNSCQLCGKCFTTSTTLKLHNCKVNEYAEREEVLYLPGESPVVEITLSTDEGQQLMEQYKDRKQHGDLTENYNQQAEQTVYVCGYCEESFDDIVLVHNHVQSYHHDVVVTPATIDGGDKEEKILYDGKIESDDVAMYVDNENVIYNDSRIVPVAKDSEEAMLDNRSSQSDINYVENCSNGVENYVDVAEDVGQQIKGLGCDGNINLIKKEIGDSNSIANELYLEETSTEVMHEVKSIIKDKKAMVDSGENVLINHREEMFKIMNSSTATTAWKTTSSTDDIVVCNSGNEFVIHINPDIDHVTTNVEISN